MSLIRSRVHRLEIVLVTLGLKRQRAKPLLEIVIRHVPGESSKHETEGFLSSTCLEIDAALILNGLFLT
jgi:hypothetical protein